MNKVWAVTMVRNEADIIEYTLSHLINQGVDGILLLDNNSEDETRVKVANMWQESPIQIILLVDPPGSGYHQSKKMTELANIAATKFGATHIMPFDADELWYSYQGKVADLMRTEGFTCQPVPQFYHYCTSLDDQSEPNPYKRIAYRTAKSRPWQKYCFKWSPGMRIGGGNHTVLDKNLNLVPQSHDFGISIRHVPCRSFEQFVNKIIRHGVSMDLQHPNDPSWAGDGPPLNFMYRTYQKNGAAGLLDIWVNGNDRSDYTGHVLVRDPGPYELVLDPAPYTGTR